MIIINNSNNLKELRLKINFLDSEIASLISKRIEIVKKVANIKKETKNFYIAERENNIFKILSQNFPEINKNILKTIFTEIISACRSYEKVFNVGLLENIHSLSAVTKILGSFTNNYFFETINSLKNNYYCLDYALVPLDNNFTMFVENIQDFFIINYFENKNSKFFLIGKTENSQLSNGKISYIVKKKDFENIKGHLSSFIYNFSTLNKNKIYLEIDYLKKEDIFEIKNILTIPYKYLGTFPNNKI